MEISEKSNFRFKALVIGLIAVILTSVCSTTVFGAFEVFNLKPEEEPFLNRKVTFTGPTHWRSDGQGRKASLFKKGEVIRKNYANDEINCGIITMVELRNVDYPYYVTGEGWISKSQIVEGSVSRYISLQFERIEGVENGLGINGVLHVDGEYVEITSDNNAIVRYDDASKSLIAAGAGSTTVKIHTDEGKEIELLAVVVGDENKEDGLTLALNLEEKTLSADLKNATVGIWDDTVTVELEGNAKAGLVVEDGKISVYAQGTGEATLNYKEKEIAKIEGDGKVTVTADPNEMSLTADLTGINDEYASQKLTILEKLTMGLREKANAKIDTKHVEASVDGGVTDGNVTNEIIGGEAGISYEYGQEDPFGHATLRVSGNDVAGTGEQKIPLISGLKLLIGTIR